MRRAFFAFVRRHKTQWNDEHIRADVLSWLDTKHASALESIEEDSRIECQHAQANERSRLKAFLSEDGTHYLQDDQPLYDYCEASGFRAEKGEFDGAPGLDDFLKDFAIKCDNSTGIRRREISYRVFRLGADRILAREKRRSTTKLADPTHILTLYCEDPDEPHISFKYRDIREAQENKPQANKPGWHGRAVRAGQIFYLTAVADDFADAGMLILWKHPQHSHILVGTQLAKLDAPNRESKLPYEYTIARRVAAIEMLPGKISAADSEAALEWLYRDPIGALITINEEAPQRRGKSD
jgi:hypothetical protein